MKGSFAIASAERVYVYDAPANMGKSFKGLSLLVEKQMKRKPLSGDLYLFCNKRRTYIKVFYFHKGGLCIFAKQLPSGHFDLEAIQGSSHITIREMASLLDVVQIKRPKLLKAA